MLCFRRREVVGFHVITENQEARLGLVFTCLTVTMVTLVSSYMNTLTHLNVANLNFDESIDVYDHMRKSGSLSMQLFTPQIPKFAYTAILYTLAMTVMMLCQAGTGVFYERHYSYFCVVLATIFFVTFSEVMHYASKNIARYIKSKLFNHN